MVKTELAEKQTVNKYTPVLPHQAHGRMRVLAFDLTITAENAAGSKDIVVGYLPAGNVRVILESGAIMGTTAASLSVGLGSYTPVNGGAQVAADPVAIAASAAIASIKRKTGSGVVYSSATRVPVTLTGSADLKAADTISGYITYIVD